MSHDPNLVAIRHVERYADSRIADTVSDLLRAEINRDWLKGAGATNRLVVVKPNWVEESHSTRRNEWEQVITHPSVVCAVVRNLAEWMDGHGTICVCDAPSTYVDFPAVVARGALSESLACLRRDFPRVCIELLDLRREIWRRRDGVIVERRPNAPDPLGYTRLDLGRESLFVGHPGEGRYYGADYDTGAVNAHHRGDLHEYLLSGTAMRCDLFVNLPKLKVHKKTGITCALKNLVGINGDKNWLPHYVEGPPSAGGDEFPEESLANYVERRVKKAAQKMALALPGAGTWAYRKIRGVGRSVLGDSDTVIRAGNWEGNDTCWRMALDLNRALLYGNPDGTWRERDEPKPYIAIVDAVIGGEGNAPLSPDPVESHVLMSGSDPAAVDAVACKLLGFDPWRLPIVREAFAPHRWPIARCRADEIEVDDGRLGRTIRLDEVEPAVPGGFRPHFGWPSLRAAARSGS